MSKHTAGPWSADWDDNGQWYVNIGGLSVSGNALRGDSGDCVESANARLIAAAPELLEAVKLAEWIRAELDEQDHCPVCKAWKSYGHNNSCPINATIRRAEGRPVTERAIVARLKLVKALKDWREAAGLRISHRKTLEEIWPTLVTTDKWLVVERIMPELQCDDVDEEDDCRACRAIQEWSYVAKAAKKAGLA